MIFLPNNIAGLSEVCAKQDTKYALTHVRVRVNENGSYIADATDTCILAQITGPGCDGSKHPCKPTLEASPNGGTQTLIPGDVFHDALKQSAKAKKAAKLNQALGLLGVQIAAPTGGTDAKNEYNLKWGGAVLATSDGSANRIESIIEQDGVRYPPIDDIIPRYTQNPYARIRLSIPYLRRLLDAAEQVSDSITIEAHTLNPDGEHPDITKPVLFKSSNASGQTFVGAVLPLTPESKQPLAK